MLGDIWTSTVLWPTMRALCDDFGGRFVGSADERNAAAYLVRTLKSYGLSNVHTEAFPIHGWQRGAAGITAAGHELDCIGLPGTPSCDVAAPLVFVGNGEPVDFEPLASKLKGAIALVRGVGSHRLEKYFRAVNAGCVGFIFGGAEAGALPPTGSIEFGGMPAPIPGVGVSYETAARLQRMGADAAIMVRMRVKAKLFDANGLNVIADIPAVGASEGGPYIMVCAHYDGHDIAQGAVDNASGVAAVIEAARALMQVREHLNIGIRVALWSGEEMGMIGSAAYAEAHKDELRDVRFVFNCDIVGNPGGIWLGINGHDTDRLGAFFESLAAERVHDLRITGNKVIVPYSDHFSFYMHGVPALMMANGEPKHPHAGPHTWGDTLDKVDVRGLRHSTAFTARALLHLANDPTPLPTRHARVAEVKKALTEAGFKPLLQAQGRWVL